MRYLTIALGLSLLLPNLAAANDGYGFVKLGRTVTSLPEYNTPSTMIIGFGNEFESSSIELSYLAFDRFALHQNYNSYIDLQSSRLSYSQHFDVGWPKLTVGLSAIYYDANAFYSNVEIATEYDFTYGASIGLRFPLGSEFNITMDGDISMDILGQDLKHFSIGLQKEFR